MDGPEPTAVTLDYVATEDLQDVDDAQEVMKVLVENLKSKDWQLAFNSLTQLRQLAKYHAELLLESMSDVLEAVLKSVKSPRSTLSKAGLMTASDLFSFCGAQTLTNIDDMLLQLLLKASQDKRFLGDEAEKALESMARSLPPHEVLAHLEPFCGHSNGRVRAQATSSFELCVSLMSPSQLEQYGFPALLKVAGKQISDQLPVARESARKLAQHLHGAYNEVQQSTSVRTGETPPETATPETAPTETAPTETAPTETATPETAPTEATPPESPWHALCKSSLGVLECSAVVAATEAQT